MISCILPVYNGERFLAEALQSVLDQDFPDQEALVVDDGSTDGTTTVLEGFGSRIRVLRQEHAGVAAARNRGLEEARGTYIAFQDADDLWMPGRLRAQMERFEARPELELCVGLLQNFWMDEVAEEGEGYRGTRMAGPLPGGLQTLLVKKTVFERVGAFDARLRVAEDVDWFLRAREAGVVEEVLPRLLARRRLHLGNLTRGDLASRESLLRSMKASLDRRRGRSGG
jgi:glycosyltransferase involved in cell wall biosynthesis